MRYDRLGFPIPEEFSPSSDAAPRVATGGRGSAGRGKRLFVLALVALVVVPGVIVPFVMPLVREAAVRWSLDRAVEREARGEAAGAIGHLDRALAWSAADDAESAALFCWRGGLRLEAGDAAGAVADADRAAAVAPTAARPRRLRALAHVVLGEPAAALADAEEAVALAGPADPEALNHRAYIRALVGRDLPAALEDVERALAGSSSETPEFLDTRGFILHLLGRHEEAVDLLNLAIDGARRARRQALLAQRQDGSAWIACQLRQIDHGLAVMHHHRARACQALGLVNQARQDFEIARRQGYDPDRGVM